MTTTGVPPKLAHLLTDGNESEPRHDRSSIQHWTEWVVMRDGVKLATDVYQPPVDRARVVAVRTPYGRARLSGLYLKLACRGYVVVSQDCRGTGDSEPDGWDYYVYEREDSLDLVDWVTGQTWYAGFIASLGGSYLASTQWCMAMHPSMSAIAPAVGGLGVVPTTRPRKHMFTHAYSRTAGRSSGGGPDALNGGYFNDPLHAPYSAALLEQFPELTTMPRRVAGSWLYRRYASSAPAVRAQIARAAFGTERVTHTVVESLGSVFGTTVNHDAHVLPRARHTDLVQRLCTPALLIGGWYDWCLDDTLATWELVRRIAPAPVRERSRLLITPAAHNLPGYHEGADDHPELNRIYNAADTAGLLEHWYDAVSTDALATWPPVIYYLMGANEWRTASAWPPPGCVTRRLYLAPGGGLSTDKPTAFADADADVYRYDPADPVPTIGGNIVSDVYVPGSVDVSALHERHDILTYTTPALDDDLDVVGPLRVLLYAASNAVDTDFSVRLSDVFPDGRAVQIQSVTLCARYRDPGIGPRLLTPGEVHRLDIDLWATANRFKAGHRLRLDVASADFPKYERNANRGGAPGDPLVAENTIYRDAARPSALIVSVLG